MKSNAIGRAARRVAVTIPLAVLAVVGATGCTATAVHPHPHSTPAAAAATVHEGAVTRLTHKPGTGGYVGALKDVKISSCAAQEAPAHFAGTVTNPTSSRQSYRIYVSLQAGTTTIGVREVDLDGLAGHATEKWSGTLPAGKSGTSCILRVERRD